MGTPSREQLLACGSITEVMRSYGMKHSRAKRLLLSEGVDFGHNNTSERAAASAKVRKANAMKLRRLKSQGVSDRKAATLLGMSVGQVILTRKEYEIGHSDERKK